MMFIVVVIKKDKNLYYICYIIGVIEIHKPSFYVFFFGNVMM